MLGKSNNHQDYFYPSVTDKIEYGCGVFLRASVECVCCCSWLGSNLLSSFIVDSEKIGADKTELCFQTAACISRVFSFIYVTLFLLSRTFFLYFSFREELAMRLDLTEARVQVSGSTFCPSYLSNGEGSGFMSSIKCSPRMEPDYNR